MKSLKIKYGKSINVSLNQILIILIIIPIFLFLYFLISGFVLNSYGVYYSNKFHEYNLKGKTLKEALQVLGEPSKIEYDSDSEGFIFVYYTDNTLLNSIGWYPLGGSRLYVDKANTVVAFDELFD